MSAPQTLFDKIWQNHLVNVQEDGTCLLYIDRHLVHEVTSPQAFEGLRNAGRPPADILCYPVYPISLRIAEHVAGQDLVADSYRLALALA